MNIDMIRQRPILTLMKGGVMQELGSTKWNQLTDEWLQKIRITQGGQIKYEYHYKNKTGALCPVIEIETHLTKQLNAYVLIEKDLRDSLSFLEEHQKILARENSTEKGILLKALGRAIIITYGKCFTKAAGRKIKLEENIISTKNDQTHKDIMTMRHAYVAHAGVSQHESCKCILLLSPAKKYFKNKKVISAYYTELYQTITTTALVEGCKPLIEEVSTKVKEKLSNLWAMIESEKVISPEQLYKIVKSSNKNRITLKKKDLYKFNCE